MENIETKVQWLCYKDEKWRRCRVCTVAAMNRLY